jgi:predicted metalloendopeptidase
MDPATRQRALEKKAAVANKIGFPDRWRDYGAIGMVIGHELSHGFDDVGRKFDPQGRLREWWAPEVASRFEKQTQCLVEQYSRFEVEPGLRVNGKLTLGENIADVAGLKQAWVAYQAWKKRHGGAAPTVPGLTADQLFFVAQAQAWCTVTTPEAERLRSATDGHSLSRFRVNGPVANHPAFGATFQCPAGAPMNPADKCVVW